MVEFRLQFPASEIEILAARFDTWDAHEDYFANVLTQRIIAEGYLRKDDFLRLCEWKSPRAKKRYKSNSEEYIQSVTQVALTTTSERLRIEVLTLLDGVSWPTASVILHFAHRDDYPILDFRAMWSLGVDWPTLKYSFAFWWDYTEFCRQQAKEAGVFMRTLDKALWQYSKENQLA